MKKRAKNVGEYSVQGEQRFRRWLIDRLKETRFSIFDGYDVRKLAERLGVQTSVLRLAQSEKADELLAAGRKYSGVERTQSRTSVQISIWMPPLIREDLELRAQRMQCTAAEITRAIAHTLLSGPDNPVVLGRQWWYHGESHPWKRDNAARIDTTVSNGARAALDLRAQRLGTTATAIMRGAIADYLEYRMEEIYFLPALQMWEDPSRYWTGELMRKGEYRGHARAAAP